MTTTFPDAPLRDSVDAALDAYTQGWLTRDRAMTDEIARLRAGQPPTSLPMFGTSRPDLAPALGVFDVTRTYLGAGKRPTSWEQDSGLRRAVERSTDAIMLSWKDPAGSWLANLMDSLGDTDRLIYATQNHEPIGDFSGNPGAYHARWDSALPILESFPEFVVPASILEGWKLAEWDAFYRDDIPVCGFDRYNPPLDRPTRYNDPSEVFGPMLDYVKAKGKRAIIGETGSRLVGSDEDGRERWAMDTHAYLAMREVEASCWWLGHPDFICPAPTFLRFISG